MKVLLLLHDFVPTGYSRVACTGWMETVPPRHQVSLTLPMGSL